eukprot:6203220-Pleurochrysis_carterae.AAC.2
MHHDILFACSPTFEDTDHKKHGFQQVRRRARIHAVCAFLAATGSLRLSPPTAARSAAAPGRTPWRLEKFVCLAARTVEGTECDELQNHRAILAAAIVPHELKSLPHKTSTWVGTEVLSAKFPGRCAGKCSDFRQNSALFDGDHQVY